MTLKKKIRLIHLWLGFLTGPVVFVVAITGAIYAFEPEISYLFKDKSLIEKKDLPYVSVDKIKSTALEQLHHINAIYYNGKDNPIGVRERGLDANGEKYNKYVFLNPYSGELIGTKPERRLSFFDVIVQLHINLMLGTVGNNIVRYATLIFVIILFSGIYLWWPKNKKGFKQRVSFKWKPETKWKRKNFDLHAVLGFYATAVVLFAVVTGLAWAFQWMDKAIYTTVTLGQPYITFETTKSVSDVTVQPVASIEDTLMHKALKDYGVAYHSKRFYFPQDENDVFRIYISPEANVYYKDASYYFDQRTGGLLKKMSAQTKNNGQLIRDMYYDIHVGQILGLPGRLLMFFACLITASLPVTGFVIWYGRNKKPPSGRAGKQKVKRTSALGGDKKEAKGNTPVQNRKPTQQKQVIQDKVSV